MDKSRFYVLFGFLLLTIFALAIRVSETWLGSIEFFLFCIFASFSLLWLAYRLSAYTPTWITPAQITLHLCAFIAGMLGYQLGDYAIASNHPYAYTHQWMVVVLPLVTYATPLFMVFYGIPFSYIRSFYAKNSNGS